MLSQVLQGDNQRQDTIAKKELAGLVKNCKKLIKISNNAVTVKFSKRLK